MDVATEMSYPTPLVNSTLLPMLLLSLARQKHTPDTARTVSTEYDYVIVGAGSAGSVLASRLSEKPCISVLLLEAGPPPPLLTEVPGITRSFWNTDIDWAYMTTPQKYAADALNNRQVPWPSGRTLGGSSVLNDLLYVRGNKKNYDDWAAEGAEGWSYKDVYPYFKKMEDNRDPEYVANGFHGVHGPQTIHRPRYQPEIKDPIFESAKNLGYRIVDPNGVRQTGFYDLQSTMRAGQRCSTAKGYLVPAENRTNLDILPNAMVTKIIIKNKRAVGVRFDFQGVSYEVSTRREVIMSAGAINSAKILMLSGIGPRKELERFRIPVVTDLPVGQNLQDHCGSILNFNLNPNIQPNLGKVVNPANIAQYIQNRTGPLGSSAFATALAFLSDGHPNPKKDSPNFELYFGEVTSEVGIQLGVTPETYARVFAPFEGRPAYSCLVHMLQPKSRGTITLQSTDPYDPPIIDPNYYEDPKDIQDIVDGLKVCLRIGNSASLRQVGSSLIQGVIPVCERYVGDQDMYLWCVAKSLVLTFSHAVGTARMGDPKDPRTVVDPQLRVKHIKGLRVIDASVMPIIPSGNTNIPTIMIAEKASDIIKKTVQCRPNMREEWGGSNNPETEDSDNPETGYSVFLKREPGSSEKLEDQPWDESQPESKWVSFSPPNFEAVKNPFKGSTPKVTPWNKEIPNAVPWNQELIQAFVPTQTIVPNRPNGMRPPQNSSLQFNNPGNMLQQPQRPENQVFNRPANQVFNRSTTQPPQFSNSGNPFQQLNTPTNQAQQQQNPSPTQVQQNPQAGIQMQGAIPLKNLQLEFNKALRKLSGNKEQFNKMSKFQKKPEQSESSNRPSQNSFPQSNNPGNIQQPQRPENQAFNRPANQVFNRPTNQPPQFSNSGNPFQRLNTPTNQAQQQQNPSPTQVQQNPQAGIQIQGVIPLKNLQLEFNKALRKLPGNKRNFNKTPKFQPTLEQSALPGATAPGDVQSSQQTAPPFTNGNIRPSQQQSATFGPNMPSNGRPPFGPAVNQQNQIFSNCDQAFCNSLSRFMQCQDGISCIRKREFARVIYDMLCS